MGLIKAAMGAASGVMGDQWKEYFYCDALPAEVLAVKGQKRTNGRSANRHSSENVISDGSVIAVADGQCVLIVEQGKVVDLCAEPGEYTYTTGTQPSLLSGGLKNIDSVFAELGKRFSFGGQAGSDQRIYYINTRELTGNKYGTPNPVPFRVVDQRAGIDIDIGIRCFGEYSYRVVNPILFYTNVCGNVENAYTRDALDGQLKTELMTALQPAFARISEQGIRYSALPGHTAELAEALNQELSAKWSRLRGIEIVSGRFRCQGQRGRRADDQGAAAQCGLYGPHPRRRASGGRTGLRHAGCRLQHRRRSRHGLYGDEPGRCSGRCQRPGSLPDGRPADRRAASGRTGRWLDLQLRPHRQHGQVLCRMRQAPARSPGCLGVQLRCKEQRQVLLECGSPGPPPSAPTAALCPPTRPTRPSSAPSAASPLGPERGLTHG